ncbi:MAG: nuclear transport factor 2 family protein [Pyrinomonadaceae bacterium]
MSEMKLKSTPLEINPAPWTAERLRSFGAAWRRGDVEELMSYMTDDCSYSASVGPEPGATYIGREAVRRGFEELLKYDAKAQGRGGRVFIAGEIGVAEWSFIYTDEAGHETEVKGVDLFEFDGDKIRRKDAYRKTKAV